MKYIELSDISDDLSWFSVDIPYRQNVSNEPTEDADGYLKSCVRSVFEPISAVRRTRFDNAKDIIMSKGCRAAYIHVAASGVSQLIRRSPFLAAFLV